jgi:hypothetical protein
MLNMCLLNIPPLVFLIAASAPVNPASAGLEGGQEDSSKPTPVSRFLRSRVPS